MVDHARIDQAQSLAAQGFYVFPITAGKKAPPRVPFKEWATRDAAKIAEWWTHNPHDNIGIYTGKFADDEALIVVDVDNKGEKNGSATILALDFAGKELPRTYSVATPSDGGVHYYYRTAAPVQGGVEVLGSGIDIRSAGGYVVADGSNIGAGGYARKREQSICVGPTWLIEACGKSEKREAPENLVEIKDTETAKARAKEYLDNHARQALEGEAGDLTTYRVAAKVKDFGVALDDAKEIMVEWNARCSPPWDYDDLCRKIENAYQYGKEAQGSLAPERVFSPVAQAPAPDGESANSTSNILPWVAEFNAEFAVVSEQGRALVYREGWDAERGCPIWISSTFEDFKKLNQNRYVGDGNSREHPIGDAWLKHPMRRQFRNGVQFSPGQSVPAGVLNLWRGFSYAPVAGDWSLLREHIRLVICGGDPELFKYVMNWFARCIQKPYEAGQVALVLRGGKGVGKGTLGDLFGSLFGPHYIHLSSSKSLVGNFNSHLRTAVFVFCDEAFFAGDRKAEGVLKSLITERLIQIEAKYQNAAPARNVTHILMASNSEWVVPASADERRYCVVDVLDARRGDHRYFRTIREQMEQGGFEAMLHEFLERDISNFNVFEIPKTDALSDQKQYSLRGTNKWLFECLSEGELGEFEWSSTGAEVPKHHAYSNYERFSKREHAFAPEGIAQWARAMNAALGPMLSERKKNRGGVREKVLVLGDLSTCRVRFSDKFGVRFDEGTGDDKVLH